MWERVLAAPDMMGTKMLQLNLCCAACGVESAFCLGMGRNGELLSKRLALFIERPRCGTMRAAGRMRARHYTVAGIRTFSSDCMVDDMRMGLPAPDYDHLGSNMECTETNFSQAPGCRFSRRAVFRAACLPAPTCRNQPSNLGCTALYSLTRCAVAPRALSFPRLDL